MQIFEKRGKWCFLEIIEDQGIRKLHKFGTKEEARVALGVSCIDCDCDPCECTPYKDAREELVDGSEKKEENSKEEASTDKQASVLSSKGPSKKKV